MTVGERIKERRIELGLSQSELAAKMGYSDKTAVSKAETKGDNITTTKVAKFAKALDCSFEYLMGWEDNLTDESAEVMANLMKVAEDAVFLQKYYSLSEENKKEVHNYVDFLLSKERANKD